jgi:hypothetical protein
MAIESADGDLVCSGCGRPEALVRARRVLGAAELEDSDSMLGREAWFHRSHVPLGWRALDVDPTTDETLPPGTLA